MRVSKKSAGERTHDRLRVAMRFLTIETTRVRWPLSSRWLSGERVDQREEEVKSSLVAADFVCALPSWDRVSCNRYARRQKRNERQAAQITKQRRNRVFRLCPTNLSKCGPWTDKNVPPPRRFWLGFELVRRPGFQLLRATTRNEGDTRQRRADVAPSDVIVGSASCGAEICR